MLQDIPLLLSRYSAGMADKPYRVYKANFPFKARVETELTMEVDHMIRVFQLEDGTWPDTEGWINGKKFYGDFRNPVESWHYSKACRHRTMNTHSVRFNRVRTANKLKTNPDQMRIEPIHFWRWIETGLG